MRTYEELFILRPDAPEEEIDPFIEQIKQVILGGGGTVEKVDKWGVRKLAYRVMKRDEGYYILVEFAAGPTVVKEIERRLRVSDMVLKFLTVRVDEKRQRIEKRRKMREKRAHRKPAAPVVGPGAPSPDQVPMPAEPRAEKE